MMNTKMLSYFILFSAVDCKLGPWGDWSPCGKSCGTDSIQERTRHILQMPRRNGAPCEARLERRYCSLPQCPDQATRVRIDM